MCMHTNYVGSWIIEDPLNCDLILKYVIPTNSCLKFRASIYESQGSILGTYHKHLLIHYLFA